LSMARRKNRAGGPAGKKVRKKAFAGGLPRARRRRKKDQGPRAPQSQGRGIGQGQKRFPKDRVCARGPRGAGTRPNTDCDGRRGGWVEHTTAQRDMGRGEEKHPASRFEPHKLRAETKGSVPAARRRARGPHRAKRPGADQSGGGGFSPQKSLQAGGRPACLWACLVLFV